MKRRKIDEVERLQNSDSSEYSEIDEVSRRASEAIVRRVSEAIAQANANNIEVASNGSNSSSDSEDYNGSIASYHDADSYPYEEDDEHAESENNVGVTGVLLSRSCTSADSDENSDESYDSDVVSESVVAAAQLRWLLLNPPPPPTTTPPPLEQQSVHNNKRNKQDFGLSAFKMHVAVAKDDDSPDSGSDAEAERAAKDHLSYTTPRISRS